MQTSVVNVSVAHIRPEYANFQEWCADPHNVYVGRQGRVFVNGKPFVHAASRFANPYRVGKDGTRDEVISKYRVWIQEQLDSGRIAQAELLALRGKRLGCWCKPHACHADVLLALLE